jgi:hypothetical protein
MNNGDIVKTAELCQSAGNEEYVAWCMDNLARQIHPLTNGDPTKAFSLCQQEGPDWYNNCIIVNAGSFYSVGGRAQAVYICQNVPSELKNECFSRVMGQIASDPIDKKEKEAICQTIEFPFKTQCFSAIGSST